MKIFTFEEETEKNCKNWNQIFQQRLQDFIWDSENENIYI